MNDPTVTVYRYRAFDPQTGDWVVQLCKGTDECINQVSGKIIAGTAEQVHWRSANSDGHYIPR